jgi:hypothetical protein
MADKKQQKDTAHDFYLYSGGSQSSGSHPKAKNATRNREKKQLEKLRQKGETRQKTGLA